MRQPLEKTTLTLTRRYLLHPEEFWGAESPRQARKLTNFLRSAMQPGEQVAGVIAEILAIARLRLNHAPAPIYLPNIGSSGSHWLEAMLSIACGVHACGEVYFPKAIRGTLGTLPAADVAYFLHAVYAAHAGSVGPHLVAGQMVNSAHMVNVSTLASLTAGARKMLLMRNPVDVAMSRTLRKPLHRAEVAPDSDDRTFLARNCEVVERFYTVIATQDFDGRVRYEDLVAQPVETLTAVVEALGLSATPAALQKAVESTSRDAIRSARARGEKSTINLFSGKVRTDDALEAWARVRLADCCAQLGYGT